MSNLPISRLVNVSVVLSALAAQAQNTTDLLVLTSTDVIDVIERLRTYDSLDEVADDFGSSGPEYASAALWFEQTPQPTQIKFGRWAETATKGKLVCGTLASADQVVSAWTGIDDAAIKIGVDALAAMDVTDMDFTGAANLPAVAAVIQTAIRNADVAFTNSTVTYNAVYDRFEFESGTTGATSKVLFLQAPATGTDISGKLKGLVGSSGAYRADGIAAETALAATIIFDDRFGQSWYGLAIPQADDDAQVAVAGYVEAATNKHFLGVSTQDAGVLSSVGTTDIAYRLKALGYKKTATQYSSASAYSVCSLLGRILTVDYGGNNTTITLMYKQEPGIVAENLTATQVDALAAKNCNAFIEYNNNTAIIQNGVVASGDFIDTIIGADNFAVQVMTAVYNLLYTSPTKIPQTDAGMHLIVTTIEAVCSGFVSNGFLAAGVWDQAGFGSLSQGDFLPKGFYVYAQPIAKQLQADRQARKATTIQVAAKCAGAVHTADIILNIAR